MSFYPLRLFAMQRALLVDFYFRQNLYMVWSIIVIAKMERAVLVGCNLKVGDKLAAAVSFEGSNQWLEVWQVSFARGIP